MKRKNGKLRRKTAAPSAPKVSEAIWEFAGEFIRLGETLEDKQNRLNAACSAWNMACNPPQAHDRLLSQYIKSYRSYNPDVTEEQLCDIRGDMEKLMRNKLALFPTFCKQIVGARISRAAGQDRIDVVSMRVE